MQRAVLTCASWACTRSSHRTNLCSSACTQGAKDSTHMLQAIEIGPLKGREGPCTLYLKNLSCHYTEFLRWFSEAGWLLRSVTRVYLFPPEAASHCAPTMQELAAKVIADGRRQCTLRLQVAPKNQEFAFGVCIALPCEIGFPGQNRLTLLLVIVLFTDLFSANLARI